MLEMIEAPKRSQPGRRTDGRTKNADKADCATAGGSGVERGPAEGEGWGLPGPQR